MDARSSVPVSVGGTPAICMALIAELGSDGMTMVVVTHEMGFARSASDAVNFMDHGHVVESGPPEQIFEAAETDRLRRFLSQVL
jgi:polar amino acid transport system ATP-binding protein